MIAYLRIALEEIAKAKTIHVRVTANGRTTEADLLMLVLPLRINVSECLTISYPA
jgi:hypothetical protein